MVRFFPRLVLPILLGLAVSAQWLGAQAPQPIAVEDLGRSTVALDGPWEFHTGDDLAWATPGFDDSQWQRMSADKPWDEQGLWGYDGFAWYRRTIRFGEAGEQGAKQAATVGVLIPSVGDAYEVYWNGTLVGGSGKLPPHPSWYGDSSAAVTLGPVRDGVLAIRVWRAPYMSIACYDSGGLRAAPLVGLGDEIAAQAKARSNLSFRFDISYLILSPLYLLAVILGLLAWLSGRSKTAYLWMAIFSVSMLAMLVFSIPLGFRATEPLLLSINRAGVGVRDIALWYMLLWLLDLHTRKTLRQITGILASIVVAIIVVYVFLLMVAWPSGWARAAHNVEGILAGVYALPGFWSLGIAGIALGSGKRLGMSRWLLAVATILTQLLVVARNLSIIDPPLTHWVWTVKLLLPLAVIDGMAIHQHTVTDTMVLAALVYAFYRDSVEGRKRHVQLEQEFQNAREVQQVLIPEALPKVPGYALSSAYKPALKVGGDFFQIIPHEDRSTLVIVGDVSGKGLKAAMAVSLIVGTMRALAEDYPAPGLLLEKVNHRLHGRLQGGFATCIVLRLHPDGRCEMASAGHPPPFFNAREIDLQGAFPLGLTPATQYEEATIRLSGSDCLILFTDGLLEARSASGELFGFERMKALFETQPTAEQAAQVAIDFGQDDDITVLTLTVQL